MQRRYTFYVYIVASASGTLYVGMTNDIERRIAEHRSGFKDGFTKRYRCVKLVYVEFHRYVLNAIEREKTLKRLHRKEKEALIASMNPRWLDLSDSLGV